LNTACPFPQRSGETGIRTPDTDLTPYNGLANRRLQPLGHLSGDRMKVKAVALKGKGGAGVAGYRLLAAGCWKRNALIGNQQPPHPLVNSSVE
jgi:hypothetical protein